MQKEVVAGLCPLTPGDVDSALRTISNNLVVHRGLNERYVHHVFTHQLQTSFPCLELGVPHSARSLHPEWPTFKKSTGIACAKYRNTNFPNGRRCYMPVDCGDETGSSGFVDFAIGRYESPEIGAEFCVKFAWANEEIVYDFMKIIDGRNPFAVGFAHVMILRDSRLTSLRGKSILEERMNASLLEAIHRLDGEWDVRRDIRLTVSEIAIEGRRHWRFNPRNKVFEEDANV